MFELKIGPVSHLTYEFNTPDISLFSQTIFQDESGLGAWNRRWCSVQDNKIYYWLYPEDEVNQNKVIRTEITGKITRYFTHYSSGFMGLDLWKYGSQALISGI